MYCDIGKDVVCSRDTLKEGMCPVKWALNCVSAAHEVDCGKSVTCRDGITQLKTILTDLVNGHAEAEDVDLALELAKYIATTPGCELSELTAKNVLWSIETYRSEWDNHRRKRCTALECFYDVYVDPAKCTGCGQCPSICPAGAVAGGAGMISVVDSARCTHCGKCFEACPAGAFTKAGMVKPSLPEAPVPVGSFSGDAAGGRRRRRRGGDAE